MNYQYITNWKRTKLYKKLKEIPTELLLKYKEESIEMCRKSKFKTEKDHERKWITCINFILEERKDIIDYEIRI